MSEQSIIENSTNTNMNSNESTTVLTESNAFNQADNQNTDTSNLANNSEGQRVFKTDKPGFNRHVSLFDNCLLNRIGTLFFFK